MVLPTDMGIPLGDEYPAHNPDPSSDYDGYFNSSFQDYLDDEFERAFEEQYAALAYSLDQSEKDPGYDWLGEPFNRDSFEDDPDDPREWAERAEQSLETQSAQQEKFYPLAKSGRRIHALGNVRSIRFTERSPRIELGRPDRRRKWRRHKQRVITEIEMRV